MANNDGGCGCMCALLLGFVIGMAIGIDSISKQAIESGAAEYNETTNRLEWKHVKDKESNGN